MDFSNPVTIAALNRVLPRTHPLFPRGDAGGIPAEANTVLLNGEIALVGGSGEFFCNHSRRLKERSYVGPTLFFRLLQRPQHVLPDHRGGLRRGLRRRRPDVPLAVGAGEQMMNQALSTFTNWRNKITKAVPTTKP